MPEQTSEKASSLRMRAGRLIVRFGLRVALGPRDHYGDVTIERARPAGEADDA